MIRAEVQTSTRNFVFCEDTETEARAYIDRLKANGIDVKKVEYFDRDERIAAIRAGQV